MIRNEACAKASRLAVLAAALALTMVVGGVSTRAEEGVAESWEDTAPVEEQIVNEDEAYSEDDLVVEESQQLDEGVEETAPDDSSIYETDEQLEIQAEREAIEDTSESLEPVDDSPMELETMSTESSAYLSALNSYINKYGSPSKSSKRSVGPGGGWETVIYATGVCLAHPIDYDGDGLEDEMLVCYATSASGYWCPKTYYVEVWQYRSSSSSSTKYGNAITYGSGKVAIVEKNQLGSSFSDGENGLPVAYLVEKGKQHSISTSLASGTYSLARYYFNIFDDSRFDVNAVYPHQYDYNTTVSRASRIKSYTVNECLSITNETLALLRSGGNGVVFADVSGSTPHIEDVRWLASMGISTGWVEPGGLRTFRGMDTVKRQDMAAFLFRLARSRGLVSDSWQPSASQRRAFSDVSSSTPHAREIWWLASAGITTGYPDGTFRGMDTVKRQDMAAFLFRLAKRMGRGGATDSWQPTSSQRTRFNDVTASTPHAREVWWLAAKGVSTGYSDRTFRGGDPVYRQDMAAFLHRLYNL